MGASTNAFTPSGGLSRANKLCSMGRRKAMVLPVPVSACSSKSGGLDKDANCLGMTSFCTGVKRAPAPTEASRPRFSRSSRGNSWKSAGVKTRRSERMALAMALATANGRGFHRALRTPTQRKRPSSSTSWAPEI